MAPKRRITCNSDTFYMIEEQHRKNYIIGLAHLWAAEVIGFAAKRLSDILDMPENRFVSEMERKEIIMFMTTYLDHLLNAYDMQLKSLTDNVK